jgi:hypothetical protein
MSSPAAICARHDGPPSRVRHAIWAKRQPRAHCLLGAEERERCQALLRRLGYELMEQDPR